MRFSVKVASMVGIATMEIKNYQSIVYEQNNVGATAARRSCRKKGDMPEAKQAIIQYAYEKSGYNKRFVGTLDIENAGTWDSQIQSKAYLKTTNGRTTICRGDYTGCRREQSFGICQISKVFHPEIVNDSNFNNPYWQIDQCIKLWNGGTKFYGAKRAMEALKNFECI